MPRPSPVLSAAVITAAFALATSAEADTFACTYSQVCTPEGLCADHSTALTLVAPLMTVDNQTGATDGAMQTPGTISDAGTGADGGGRSYGMPQLGKVQWGTRVVSVIEPTRDREDSTRAFTSVGADDYVLSVTPDLRSQLAYFVDSALVSILDGTCVDLEDDTQETDSGA